MSITAFNEGAAVRSEDFIAFAELIPNMVWVADEVGDIEYFNRFGRDYAGRGSDAYSGQRWLDLVHPDDVEPTTRAWSAAVASGGAYEVEFRLRRHDGVFRWHRSTAFPILDPAGGMRGWVGAANDVDDEHRTIAHLHAAERFGAETLSVLETLQTNAPIGLGLVDTSLRIVRENDMLAMFCGGIARDHIGQLVQDTIPELWRSLEPTLRQVLESGAPCLNHPFSFESPDGVRDTLNSYYPVYLDGEVLGLGVVVIDVTERTQAEHARRQLTLAAISAVASAVETRDPYTAGHQRRVAALAAVIAEEIGLGADEVYGIRLAADIHDIGKLGVPSEILACPRRLTAPEYELVKTHAQLGRDIIAGIDFPWPIADMILQHHERLDGSGYPQGLRGDEIVIGARIIAVADTVEAMASHRPYRPAIGIDAALNQIIANRGRLYDPVVADACVNLFCRGEVAMETLDRVVAE